MQQQTAEPAELEAVADACLGYLAGSPEELARFMQISGYSPEGLRSAVGSRAFALGLIDYFAANEPALVAMCANSGISVERFMRLWVRLNPTG
ncbi:MAG TPA: DUF3572 family protein [Devosiaceae bacterium]